MPRACGKDNMSHLMDDKEAIVPRPENRGRLGILSHLRLMETRLNLSLICRLESINQRKP